jgi:hypothetical protein
MVDLFEVHTAAAAQPGAVERTAIVSTTWGKRHRDQ